MAAMADPEGAWRAYEEGREARRKSEYARAEERFRMAAKLARASRAWETLALAQLGIAKVARQRGNYPLARRRFGQALRTSRKYGIAVVEGMVLHDLFVLACDVCEKKEAMRLAEEAFEIHKSIQHHDLPRLAHDVGYYWITVGDYHSALSVIRAALPFVSGSEEEMVVWGNIARAAAGSQRLSEFEEACAQVEKLIRSAGSEEHAARSLLSVAVGALTLNDWELAERKALDALAVAQRRAEARIRFEAEALLTSLHLRKAVEAPSVPPTLRRRALARNFVQTLRERTP